MKIWRIGSKWDQKDLTGIFKKHNIAFAGSSVQKSMDSVSEGDLACITKGRSIVAVGRIDRITDLQNIDQALAEEFAYVQALVFDSLYFLGDYNIPHQTYGGQGKQFHEVHGNYYNQIKKNFNEIRKKNMDNKIINLLEYKKQIILQGPPGTGKTRLAKEIAIALSASSISDEDILDSIHPDLDLTCPELAEAFKIVSIKGDVIRVWIPSSGKDYPVFLREIKKRIIKSFLKEPFPDLINGHIDAVSWYVFKKFKEKNVCLIQFHPSYSYDDFVRGIVVDTSDGIVNYVSVNKIFGEIAQKAWKNYQDSKKTPDQISQEQKLDKLIDMFRDYLDDEIENHKGKLFLEGTTTYLFKVDEDAVRYTGDNWKLVSGQRLLFSDIKKLFISNASSRQEIKNNPNVSGLAKHHSSYFLRVLDLFRNFIEGKHVSESEKQPIQELSYVLIIDEINRANLPSVLGELIYGLEYRGEPVESIYEVDGSRSITIPPNLYIIGTMNTADRSVGHIDYAIRRRFAFVDVLPRLEPVHDHAKVNFELVSSLFVKNPKEALTANSTPERSDCLSPDFRPEDVWIGHSYFLTDKRGEEAKQELSIKMKYEVVPLLKEYLKDGILIDEVKVKEVIHTISQ